MAKGPQSFFERKVCFAAGLPTKIVPHQLRHTYATEMLRSGVSFPSVMKLLGHTSPDMTMLYVDITLTDLAREFHQARSNPRHLAPQPKLPECFLTHWSKPGQPDLALLPLLEKLNQRVSRLRTIEIILVRRLERRPRCLRRGSLVNERLKISKEC